MQSFFAITTYGLESVSVEEIGALPGVVVDSVGYRLVRGRISHLPDLTRLRTVDDACALSAVWEGIGHTRDNLRRIRELATDIQLAESPAPTNVAVSVSFVGSRNYTTSEIKQAVGVAIEDANRATYVADERQADQVVRVFIEGAVAMVGLRIGKRPLRIRSYEKRAVAGSTPAPLAAAMARLIGANGKRLIDPCCGSGTVAIEAAHLGATVVASDIDPRVLEVAALNCAWADASVELSLSDAASLPWFDGEFDGAISNLPWGHQTRHHGDPSRVISEVARVVRPQGKAVLLDVRAIASPGFQTLAALPVSLRGTRAVVNILRKLV